jgi:hypothetical protein
MLVSNFLRAYPESPLLKDLTLVERAGLKPTPTWAVNRVVQYLMRRLHTERRVERPGEVQGIAGVRFESLPPLS